MLTFRSFQSVLYINLEKETSSYAEISIDETSLTANHQNILLSSFRSVDSIRHDNNAHETTTTTSIKTDDIITSTTFT